MLPWSADLAGRIDEHVITSELLRANPLGDPCERPLLVYLPPGYDDDPARSYPAVYVIQGYTGHVTMWHNRSAYRQPFPETADAVFAAGQAPPAIVVYVDAWTDYGGDIWRWWDDFRSRTSFTKEADHDLLMLLGVSACFSAEPDGTVELPFDPHTGVLRPEVWQRWLDWDPVRMVPRYAAELRSLRAIWIDAGTRDDYFLDLGAEAFRAALREAGVPGEVIRFELFDATHAGIDYRYPLSLAWLCQRI